MCSLYAEGDIFKILISTTVVEIYTLYAMTWMAPLATELAAKTGYIASTSTLVTGSSIEEWNCVLIGLIGKLAHAW